MTVWMLAAAALAGTTIDADVAYLWRTAQADKALAMIDEAYTANPDDLAHQRLFIAAEVHRGNGGAMELQFRQAYTDDNENLRERLALATLLAYRNAKKGDWCKDANALLAPIGSDDAELYRETVRVSTLTHVRCDESTETDQAAWAKIITSGQLGAPEAAVFDAGRGYAGDDLPDTLKAALAESPRHLEYLFPLWDEDTGGPGLEMSLKVANKAAKTAMGGDDPQAAAAAYWLYKAVGSERGTQKALTAWSALDPDADPAFTGTTADISDPKIYKRMDKAGSDIDALDALADKIPDSGYLAAYYHYQRFLALKKADRDEDAFAAVLTAYRAAPDVIVIAAKFAQAAAGQSRELELAVTAIETAMANPDSKRQVVRLFIRSKLYTALERYDEAEADLLSLFQQKPTSRLYHRSLGNLYRTMDETESAIVHYTAAMQDPKAEAPAEKSEKRRNALIASDADWVAGPKKLKNKAFPIALPESRAPVTAVVVGASWSAPTKTTLADLADLVDSHAKAGFKAVAILVDRNEPDLTELEAANPKVSLLYKGSDAARLGRIHSVPTLYVLDQNQKVLGAFHDGGWMRATELILSHLK
jgi:hypothetical protein